MATGHQRLHVNRVDPKAYQAVLAMETNVRTSGLDARLYELVKIRASQLNGCAFCLDMHNRDARKAGEDQRRLDALSAWREAPELFTDVERAALAFTEAVTRTATRVFPIRSATMSPSASRPASSTCSWPLRRSTCGIGWQL